MFLPGSIADQVRLYSNDMPEYSKLRHLIFIACLYFLRPIIEPARYCSSPERLAEIVEYCIDIDADKLEKEIRLDEQRVDLAPDEGLHR